MSSSTVNAPGPDEVIVPEKFLRPGTPSSLDGIDSPVNSPEARHAAGSAQSPLKDASMLPSVPESACFPRKSSAGSGRGSARAMRASVPMTASDARKAQPVILPFSRVQSAESDAGPNRVPAGPRNAILSADAVRPASDSEKEKRPESCGSSSAASPGASWARTSERSSDAATEGILPRSNAMRSRASPKPWLTTPPRPSRERTAATFVRVRSA